MNEFSGIRIVSREFRASPTSRQTSGKNKTFGYFR